jgi:hypothetical protein
MKQFLIIVAAIVVSLLIIRGCMGFTGQSFDPNEKKIEGQYEEYQIVPCADHPEAIGC